MSGAVSSPSLPQLASESQYGKIIKNLQDFKQTPESMIKYILDLLQKEHGGTPINSYQMEAIAQSYRFIQSSKDIDDEINKLDDENDKKTVRVRLDRLVSNLDMLAKYMKANEIEINPSKETEADAKEKLATFFKYAYPDADLLKDSKGNQLELPLDRMPGKAVKLPAVEAAKNKLNKASEDALEMARVLFPARTRFFEEVNKDDIAAAEFEKRIRDLIAKHQSLDDKKGQIATALGQVMSSLPSDPKARAEISKRILRSLALSDSRILIVPSETPPAAQKGGTQEDTIFEQFLTGKINKSAETKIKPIKEELDGKISQTKADTQELTSKVNQLSGALSNIQRQTGEIQQGVEKQMNQELVKITETYKTILEKLQPLGPTRGGGAGPLVFVGGADEEAPKKDPVAAAKENQALLGEAKRAAQAAEEMLDSIRRRYERFSKTRSEGEASMKTYKDATPAPAPETKKDLENKILGYYSYLKEDGKAIVAEVREKAKAVTESLKQAQAYMAKVLGSDPNNQRFKEVLTDLRVLFDEKTMSDAERDAILKKLGTDNKETPSAPESAGKDVGLLTNIARIGEGIGVEFEEVYGKARSTAETIQAQRAYELETTKAQQRPGQVFGDLFRGREPPKPGNEQGAPPKPAAPPAATQAGGADGTGNVELELAVATQKITEKLLPKVAEVEKTFAGFTDPVAASFAADDNLFTKMYSQYLQKRADKNESAYLAEEELAAGLRANNLVPRDVLRVNTFDKVLFIFVTLFIRLFALNITEYLIDRGYLTTLSFVMGTYVGIFLLFLGAFVLLVNLDLYRMRILFNYVNFNANSARVYTYAGAFVFVSVLIYFIMWNMNVPLAGSIRPRAVSEEEKVRLRYRLEVLSLIQWVLLTILVILS